MNKVITINLDGTAYQLEEAGYDVLRSYLETAAARLQNNPDRDEILSDIERAIAEKFRALLGNHKTVVVTKEVSAVVAEMGPINADPAQGPESETASPGGPGISGEQQTAGNAGMPRRLYKIYDGAMISGVCNGIAAYFNIDPTFVRLAFVFLTMLWGAGLLVYIVMAIVVPEARSPEQKAAAYGAPWTAQQFIRRAKEGYYEATKSFPDPKARREWQRQFKREMRANAYQWRRNWHGYWAERAPIHPGLGFTLPFLSLLQGAAVVLFICALIQLLNTSAVFGLALPPKVPIWAGALLLFIAYGVLAAPLKIARRACYWGLGQPKWSFPIVFFLDAIVWVIVAAVLLWLAVHFSPELREAIKSIPSIAHQAADDIRNWWKGK